MPLAAVDDANLAEGFDTIAPRKQRVVQPESPRVVYVAVVGAPNVGKSTLVNRLVGEKVSIVSRKRNTTRESVLGIFTVGNTQVVRFMARLIVIADAITRCCWTRRASFPPKTLAGTRVDF